LGVLAKRIEPSIPFDFDHLTNFLSKKFQIWIGIGFGCCSFLLSINRITVFNNITIDMRYIMIYFLVIYGSRLVGSCSAVTLVALKFAHYFFFLHLDWPFYLNNVVMTFAVLFLSLYLSTKKWP